VIIRSGCNTWTSGNGVAINSNLSADRIDQHFVTPKKVS
jgi:hypothetical protein